MDIKLLKQHTHRHGALVRDELVPTHLSRSAWYRAHDAGHLAAIHPGVSRLSAMVPTAHLRIEAALAALPGSIAAGRTAAWLWGSEAAQSDAVELLVPHRCRPRPLDGIAIHRTREHPFPRRVPVKGLVASEPLRATLEVAAWHPDLLDTVLAELVVAGRFGIDAVRTHLARQRRKGRPGVTALEQALATWKLGEKPPASLLERAMSGLLERYCLPPAQFQRPLGKYYPDFTFLEEFAVAECDGWGTHGRTRLQFDDDREREADLNVLGFVVWRYSWMQITNRASWVARTLRQRLDVRRRELGLDPSSRPAA